MPWYMGVHHGEGAPISMEPNHTDWTGDEDTPSASTEPGQGPGGAPEGLHLPPVQECGRLWAAPAQSGCRAQGHVGLMG